MIRELQGETRKEIYAAKKILYEGDNSTKKTFIVLLLAIVSLLGLAFLSFVGTVDTWECELDSSNPKHEKFCRGLRQAASCKTLSGPIRAEVLLNIDNDVKASAIVICPWEIAISELRVCFCLMSVLAGVIGIYAIRRESKKYADLYFQGALFFSVILAISSYFDWLSIQNAKTNNYSFCTLSGEFQLEKNVVGEKLECTYHIYYVTVVSGIISAVLMLLSAVRMNDWRSKLVIDMM